MREELACIAAFSFCIAALIGFALFGLDWIPDRDERAVSGSEPVIEFHRTPDGVHLDLIGICEGR